MKSKMKTIKNLIRIYEKKETNLDTTLKPELKINLNRQVLTPLVIETHGLTKTYKGVEALKAVDLQVQQNSICGFLGPNGAGKSFSELTS